MLLPFVLNRAGLVAACQRGTLRQISIGPQVTRIVPIEDTAIGDSCMAHCHDCPQCSLGMVQPLGSAPFVPIDVRCRLPDLCLGFISATHLEKISVALTGVV